MKSACGVVVVFLLTGSGVQAWSGSDSNKSQADLEQMTDEQLLKEALGPCLAAGEHGAAALDYLRTIAQTVRKRHNDAQQPAFSDMLVAAAAENPRQCRKVANAGVNPLGEQKAVARPASAETADDSE